MTKNIKLNDIIYYIVDNKLHSAKVLSICKVEALQISVHTSEQSATFQPFGPPRSRYATVHGVFDEDRVFLSKEDLAKDLIS